MLALAIIGDDMANAQPISDWDEFDVADGHIRPAQKNADFSNVHGLGGMAGLGNFEKRRADPAPRREIHWHFPSEQMVAVLAALCGILGARVGLLLAGAGAFMLGLRGMDGGNIYPQLIFAITIFCPMVWLSAQQRV